MTNTDAQESVRARLNADHALMFENSVLEEALKATTKAFSLPSNTPAQVSDDRITHEAGPIQIVAAPDADAQGIEIRVSRLRDSETLHPEAETAILAEVISLLAERIGGDWVEWAPAGLTIDATRFVSAFIPLRHRGGTVRVCPRRIRRGDLTGTPIVLETEKSLPDLPLLEDDHDIRTIFATDEDATPQTTNLTKLSTWAATASVGAMNPLIGVPLAAYNLAHGTDIRVTTHALALTATLTGVIGTSFGHLPFF